MSEVMQLRENLDSVTKVQSAEKFMADQIAVKRREAAEKARKALQDKRAATISRRGISLSDPTAA